jgi:hypothetical protein
MHHADPAPGSHVDDVPPDLALAARGDEAAMAIADSDHAVHPRLRLGVGVE